ncbi:MAG TPA: hypothetical protein PKD85_06090, partial [Saprospiraceae bacterium]|nr:hypothetical protein [Saprospiraceae bacterium]
MSNKKLELIKFDKNVNIYIIFWVLIFFVFVGFKLHNSSIPFWNEFFPEEGNPRLGLISGKPLAIRSDDWLVQASNKLAQATKGFPVSNTALGAGKAPLVMGLPTTSFFSVMIPSFWGYFVLDVERGYSWAWNFSIFLYMITSFLFFMLFTYNNFYLSIFGSLWIFLSSAVQWWSFNVDLFAYGLLSLILAIYMLYGSSLKRLPWQGLLFAVSFYNFWINLYPAYQVPLSYFIIFLFIGFVIRQKESFNLFDKMFLFRIFTLFAMFAINLILMYEFFNEIKETADILSNTVYPAKRFETGGGYSILGLFSENFFQSMSETHFPPNWVNICESSAFLLVAPLASFVLIIDSIKLKKIDPILLFTLIFNIIILFFIRFGFSESLSKYTLFITVPTYRAFYIFGFANIVFTILYLGRRSSGSVFNGLNKPILLSVLLIISFLINYFLSKKVNFFFPINEILVATLIFTLFNWPVLDIKLIKRVGPFYYSICLLVLLPNIRINPISQGLEPYTKRNLYLTAKEIAEKDPKAIWNVYGQYQLSGFIKAAGVTVFNGVQYCPPLEKLMVLDSDLCFQNIYN